jgi:hypothetical protein
MSSDSERRRARRIDVSLPVTLSVLIPEVSVIPMPIKCITVDLSERGILAEAEVSQDLAAAILGQKRIVRVQFAPDVFPTKLVGTMAWTAQLNRGGKLVTRLGVFFEELDAETRRDWIVFLQSHTKTPLQ